MKNHKEIEWNLGKILPDSDSLKITFCDTVRNRCKAVIVSITDMYEKPMPDNYKGGLIGFFTDIQKAIETENLDLYGEIAENGCESCDYGSQYGWEFIGWD